MIPPIVDRQGTSPGEARVFSALAKDESTKDWTVLHSLCLGRHLTQVEGEIDFVVLIPEIGVFCLEVKGVRTLRRLDSGVWEIGKAVREARGPFRQAAEGMHSLREFVQRRQPELRAVPFLSAVVLPFLSFTEESVEWRTGQVIDRQRIRGAGIAGAVLAAARSELAHFAESPSATWYDPNQSTLSPNEVDSIVTLLRPRFEVFESPRALREHRESELIEFTEEQYRALDQMEDNRAVFFSGPAGTGKTFLAVEAAKRASSRGKQVLLICFNRLLADELQVYVKDVPNVSASTLHSFLIGVAGTRPSATKSRDSEYWSKQLPDLALEKLLEADGSIFYDMLIVDEAQDVVAPPYLDVLDLCLVDGLGGGESLWFGDFEGQNIYSEYSDPDFDPRSTLREWAGVATCLLRTNCRNVPSIAEFAHLLGGLDPNYDNVLRPDPGGRPTMTFFADDSERIDSVSQFIGELLDLGLRPADIVVLSTVARRAASSKLPPSKRYAIAELGDAPRNAVRCGTIHAFKGLEAPAVILSDFEGLEEQRLRELFYVGITRAQDHLRISASVDAKEWIQKTLSGERND